MGDVYALLCLRSARLSKAFGLKNLCYFQNICSGASRVHDCWNLAKTRVRTKKCPAAKCCIFKELMSYMPGAKNLNQK